MTSLTEAKAQNLSFDEDNFWVHLSDGRVLGVPLAYFPRLVGASRDQLKKFEISGGGIGLHWPELDEDISVTNLLRGIGDRQKKNKAS